MTEFRKYYECEFFKAFRKRDVFAIRGMLDEAYVLVNKLYSAKTFLNDTEIGTKDVRAHNLRAAIAKVAKSYCTKGILPYNFAMRPNNIGNCRHVELQFNSNTLYLARIDCTNSVPQKAQYRPTVPDREWNLFEEIKLVEEKPIDVFLATYGDGGEEKFKFGTIGILGEVSWLYDHPLVQGAYTYTSPKEKEDILVELTESAEMEIGKDEKNAEGEEK